MCCTEMDARCVQVLKHRSLIVCTLIASHLKSHSIYTCINIFFSKINRGCDASPFCILPSFVFEASKRSSCDVTTKSITKQNAKQKNQIISIYSKNNKKSKYQCHNDNNQQQGARALVQPSFHNCCLHQDNRRSRSRSSRRTSSRTQSKVPQWSTVWSRHTIQRLVVQLVASIQDEVRTENHGGNDYKNQFISSKPPSATG